MNWFGQNRFLGTFLAVFGIVALGALYFFWSARSSFGGALTFQCKARVKFDHSRVSERGESRLLKSQANDYCAQLETERTEAHVLPVRRWANEFSATRRAVTAAVRVLGSYVKLPIVLPRLRGVRSIFRQRSRRTVLGNSSQLSC